MYNNWIKRDMKKVFRSHKKFLDKIIFTSDLTTNSSRYIPATGEVVVSEKQLEVPALSRNYARTEADGELVRVTDLEVTILLDDLLKVGITPKLNDVVIFKGATWSIQSVTRDQLQTLSILQIRSLSNA